MRRRAWTFIEIAERGICAYPCSKRYKGLESFIIAEVAN